MIMKLLKSITFLLSAPRCVCCRERLDFGDRGLCKACMVEYENNKERDCSRCAKKLSFCSCPSSYLLSRKIRRHAKVYRYSYQKNESPANKIIYALKEANRSDVFEFLADELADAIRNSLGLKPDKLEYLITSVPRRAGAIRKFGYDHAREIGRRVAKRLGIKYRLLLKSRAKKPQKGMMGEERRENAIFACRRKAPSMKGIRVIIIDDIVTTGASVGRCAELIRSLGAREVMSASVAIAYKDAYTPPATSWF